MSGLLSEPPVFQALIRPYRSLSRRGLVSVIALLVVASCGFGLRFWLIGAWPVIIFSGIEIPCVLFLLALNIRRARASELVLLTASELVVTSTDGHGRQQRTSLPTAWLRVELREDGGTPRVMLRSRGRGYEVGAFLHEPEKLSLFESLQTALHGVKNPTFDNPQLREP